jgi:hypothetical protein
MINLDEIEARASRRSDSFADREEFNRHARTDVPALIARVRELEAECERTRIFGSRKFAELRAADVEQMRGYGLSYEGVRALLWDFDDGGISFAKLMDLIRAAARAMAEEECTALRREIAALMDDH